MRLIGLDLAWGERNPDGVALLRLSGGSACLEDSRVVRGDEALLEWIHQAAPPAEPALILVDGPIVCPNRTGARPVDRETHRHFGRFHAGCHPSNQERCPRPSRVAQTLISRHGFRLGWDLAEAPRLLAEVYPHPAMIRLFGLDLIVKYKRGPAPAQRREFRRLQSLLTSCLIRRFPEVVLNPLLRALLKVPRTKSAEDRLDAFVCALIGLNHVRHQGEQTQILGDRETGFLLVPR